MTEVYFEEDGIVSLWVGQVRVAEGSDFLRDDFRVEYWDPDNQECVVEASAVPFRNLLSQLSYSESFQQAAIDAAQRLGISSALWVMAQYDFDYDPMAVKLLKVPPEPRFIGAFSWHE